MEFTKALMGIAVIAVIASAVNLFTFLTVGTTGYASIDSGNVTLEIQSKIDINFTNRIINWSSGYVNNSGPAPCTVGVFATLDTNNSVNPIICGATPGWQPQTQGLVIQSDSNKDVTLNLTSTQNASSLIDNNLVLVPASTFKWRASDFTVGGDVAGACTGVASPASYADIVANQQVTICNNFNWENTFDELEIDFQLNISPQAPPQAGYRTAVIQATAIAAP